MNCLSDYDNKILIALGESLKGNKKFSDWFIENGYPELAAFSAAINSDIEAVIWLLKSNNPELGVLSNAIDNEYNALMWLYRYKYELLLNFAKACRKDDVSIRWFVNRNDRIMIHLIRIIQEIIQKQIDDSADVHKFRRS